MKNLTTLEKIASIMAIIFITCLTVLGLESATALFMYVEVTLVGILLVAFITRAMYVINNLREKREKIKDYNEIRKTIVITKMNEHVMRPEEQYILVMCNKRIQNLNTRFCKDCSHNIPHVRNEECEAMDCESIVNIIG